MLRCWRPPPTPTFFPKPKGVEQSNNGNSTKARNTTLSFAQHKTGRQASQQPSKQARKQASKQASLPIDCLTYDLPSLLADPQTSNPANQQTSKPASRGYGTGSVFSCLIQGEASSVLPCFPLQLLRAALPGSKRTLNVLEPSGPVLVDRRDAGAGVVASN